MVRGKTSDESSALTIWIPQSYAEAGLPFRARVVAEHPDVNGSPAHFAGEPAGDGKVWVEVAMQDMQGDGSRHLLPAAEGGAILTTLRVLPRGAGEHELHRAGKKRDPANIVALVAGLLLALYYVVFR